MHIYGYGEDALTLWAMQNRLGAMLNALGDESEPAQCQVFFRPSFGRKGGACSPQFGEFDFIILAEGHLYLGESKWDKSTEQLGDGTLALRPEQTLRHRVFRFYVKEWAWGDHASWPEFREASQITLHKLAQKPIPAKDSLLAQNLRAVLGIVRRHYVSLPIVQDVLLYLYDSRVTKELPREVSNGFELVPLDYSEASVDGFVTIRL